MGQSPNRHSFRPLLFVPPQGPDALPETVREPKPVAKRLDAGESHVRLRAVPAASIDWLDASFVLDELGEEQLALGVSLACLEEAVAIAPRSPAVRGVWSALERRVRDLGALRDALAAVHVATVDRDAQSVFAADTVAADYLRGLYAWGHAVVRALDDLVAALRAQRPDWALLRFRLEEAKNFHFDDLDEPIRADVAALAPGHGKHDLAAALENLFQVAGRLEAGLDERFSAG